MQGRETACVADGGFQGKTGGQEGCHKVGEGVGAVDEVREEGTMRGQDCGGRQGRREGEDIVFGDLGRVRASCQDSDSFYLGLSRLAL